MCIYRYIDIYRYLGLESQRTGVRRGVELMTRTNTSPPSHFHTCTFFCAHPPDAPLPNTDCVLTISFLFPVSIFIHTLHFLATSLSPDCFSFLTLMLFQPPSFPYHPNRPLHLTFPLHLFSPPPLFLLQSASRLL